MKKQTTIRAWFLAVLALIALNFQTMAQDAEVIEGLVYDVAGYNSATQDISKLPKMERDIVILQNVLNDLFNGTRGSFYSSRGSKGMYVPGKGVIFNVGFNNNNFEVIFAEQHLQAVSQNTQEEEEEKSVEEVNKERQDKIESLANEFLANYGSILSELKSGEKVMLNVNYNLLKKVERKNGTRVVSGVAVTPSRSFYSGSRGEKKRLVSSIDYSDIQRYLNGNASLESTTQKISRTIVDENGSSSTDAKIMAGILDDLFRSNFDGAFKRSRKTSWTYFEGFGLMYDLNISTGRSGSFIYVTTDHDNRNDEKKADKSPTELAEENYDDLIELVKESLVTYGRTLRSVKSDEVVILNINFGSSFRKSKLPKAVRLQVKKSQIEAYSKGQKSLDQLKNEIDVKSLRSSLTGSGGNFLYPASQGGSLAYPSRGSSAVGTSGSGKSKAR